MQGASSVAILGMAGIALASEAGGSKGLDADMGPLTGDGRERPSSIQNGPSRLKQIKVLDWQTPARGGFDP
jgi:hypothetical protein